MFVFWKIWRALFSYYLRFEIRPFALLPTICLGTFKGNKGSKIYLRFNMFKVKFIFESF